MHYQKAIVYCLFIKIALSYLHSHIQQYTRDGLIGEGSIEEINTTFQRWDDIIEHATILEEDVASLQAELRKMEEEKRRESESYMQNAKIIVAYIKDLEEENGVLRARLKDVLNEKHIQVNEEDFIQKNSIRKRVKSLHRVLMKKLRRYWSPKRNNWLY